MVSNGLVVTGVVVPVSQMVFVSKEMSREHRNAGGIMPQPIYIYIQIFLHIHKHTYVNRQLHEKVGGRIHR